MSTESIVKNLEKIGSLRFNITTIVFASIVLIVNLLLIFFVNEFWTRLWNVISLLFCLVLIVDSWNMSMIIMNRQKEKKQ